LSQVLQLLTVHPLQVFPLITKPGKQDVHTPTVKQDAQLVIPQEIQFALLLLVIYPGLQTAHSVAPLQTAQLATVQSSQLVPKEFGE
jgi:hypothetical protein